MEDETAMKDAEKWRQNGFWLAWANRIKDLRPAEPECTCGRKHPDECYHEDACPWLQFHNKEFADFTEKWESGRRTLFDFNQAVKQP